MAALAERKASHGKASTAAAGGAHAHTMAATSRQTILDDSMHPIRPHDLPRGVWTVLLRLRGAGALLFALNMLRPAMCMLPQWCVKRKAACAQGMRVMWWGALCATCCCGRGPRTLTLSPQLRPCR